MASPSTVTGHEAAGPERRDGSVAGPSRQRQRDYWRRIASEAPPVLDLSADLAPAAGGAVRAARHDFVMPDALGTALVKLCRQERKTMFMALLAGFAALLSRHCGQDRVVVSSPTGGGRPGQTSLLPLLVDCGGDPSYVDLLRRVREVVLDTTAYGTLPAAEMSEALGDPPPSRQVRFAVTAEPVARRSGPDDPEDAELDLWIAEDARSGSFRYHAHRWSARSVARWAEQFVRLLEGALAQPQRRLRATDLLTADDRRILAGQGRTPGAYPERATAAGLFQARVAAHPELPAVRTSAGVLSYGEVNARANHLAHHLRGRGVAPGAVVAVCVGRTSDLVVCFLAALKAGAVYLPLDPQYPPERISYILRDSAAVAVVTTTATAVDAPGARTVWLDRDAAGIGACPGTDPPPAAGPDDLAYLIYTSGSTGRPKGVEVAHRGIANLAAFLRRQFEVGPGDTTALFSSTSFDASIWEMAMALFSGATLAILDTGDRTPAETCQDIRRLEVTAGTFPPTFLRAVTRDQLDLRLVIAAGEACDDALVSAWSGGARRFVNAYGPTETTVCATVADRLVPDGRPAPIGRALPNVGAYVLGPRLEHLPVGMPGELCVDGVGLARGYRGRPALTAASFVPNPYGPPGSRLYRTGDQVRLGSDGDLRYLGRLDHQVKLRGFRIELSEIEACLMRHPEVREAALVVHGSDADQKLVAYLTLRPDPDGGPGELGGGPGRAGNLRVALHRFLSRSLPDYMVPGTYVALEAFPRTTSGKIDRSRLPAPDESGDGSGNAPDGRTEELIAAIWADELGVPQVSRDDSFFELGGHSLVAAQVIGRVRQSFQVPSLPIRTLFEQPVLGAFAAAVTAAATATPHPPLADQGVVHTS